MHLRCRWCFLHTLSTSVLVPGEDLTIPLSLTQGGWSTGILDMGVLMSIIHIHSELQPPPSFNHGKTHKGETYLKQQRKLNTQVECFQNRFYRNGKKISLWSYLVLTNAKVTPQMKHVFMNVEISYGKLASTERLNSTTMFLFLLFSKTNKLFMSWIDIWEM